MMNLSASYTVWMASPAAWVAAEAAFPSADAAPLAAEAAEDAAWQNCLTTHHLINPVGSSNIVGRSPA